MTNAPPSLDISSSPDARPILLHLDAETHHAPAHVGLPHAFEGHFLLTLLSAQPSCSLIRSPRPPFMHTLPPCSTRPTCTAPPWRALQPCQLSPRPNPASVDQLPTLTYPAPSPFPNPDPQPDGNASRALNVSSLRGGRERLGRRRGDCTRYPLRPVRAVPGGRF